MSYTKSRPPPADSSALRAYLDDELGALERETAEPSVRYVTLKQQNAVPPRVKLGMTAYADGTNWNPGAGEGVYTYYAGAWHKLG